MEPPSRSDPSAALYSPGSPRQSQVRPGNSRRNQPTSLRLNLHATAFRSEAEALSRPARDAGYAATSYALLTAQIGAGAGRLVRNEKVRGSNPLSSTKPAGQGRCPSSRTGQLVDELPKGATGKILKRSIDLDAVARLGRRVGADE